MSEEALDLDDFMERVQQDKGLLFELLDIFVGDFQLKRKSLEEAMKKNDYEGIEHIAHFLKGSCGNISAGPLRRIFLELENNGRVGTLDDTKEYLDDIDQKFEKLVVYIGELRKQLS